tara:strand:+ start:529 stop:951 length:423 start_codon:yes stop_codon:yes gene_type:complete
MLFLNLLLTTVFFFLAAIHIYWVFGGKWGHSQAIPTDKDGNFIFAPGAAATVIVAFGLSLFGLFYLNNSGLISINWPAKINSIGAWAIPCIFSLRALGDFKYVGAFKRVKGTEFAEMDSKFFSPLCFILGITGFYILINS